MHLEVFVTEILVEAVRADVTAEAVFVASMPMSQGPMTEETEYVADIVTGIFSFGFPAFPTSGHLVILVNSDALGI